MGTINKAITSVVALLFVAVTTFGSISRVGAANNTNNAVTPETIAMCMKAAIEKRDSAIITAWGTLDDSVTAALGTRKTALMAAWDESAAVERKAATKNAWDQYHTSRKSARRAFNATRKSAWKTFKTERKACKGSSYYEGTGEGRDQLL